MGRQANCAPLSSAEVKNGWSHTSATPLCLTGMLKDNINYTLIHRIGLKQSVYKGRM